MMQLMVEGRDSGAFIYSFLETMKRYPVYGGQSPAGWYVNEPDEQAIYYKMAATKAFCKFLPDGTL